MKILIIGNFHHKNKEGLEIVLKHLKWDYKYGSGNVNELRNFDVIYSQVILLTLVYFQIKNSYLVLIFLYFQIKNYYI